MRGTNEPEPRPPCPSTSDEFANEFGSDERGATATEYAVLLGFLAILLLGAIGAYGAALAGIVQGIANAVGTWV